VHRKGPNSPSDDTSPTPAFPSAEAQVKTHWNAPISAAVLKRKTYWPSCRPADPASTGKHRSLLVLTPGESSTLTLYLPRIMKEAGAVDFDLRNSLNSPPASWPFGENVWVVILRHASEEWAALLKKNRASLAKVTFFADDDLPAAAGARELPADYARRTAANYRSMLRAFRGLFDDLAVSTPELARRCGNPRVCIWPPVCPEKPSTGAPLRYFYHGTAAHLAEIEWLVPVVEEVQKAVPEAWFEIMSTVYAKKLFEGIPRVQCMHPMSWPDYFLYTSTYRQDVGLAPLLETTFNTARSHAKLFDITRCGAAGVYSAVGPFNHHVVDGETGVLLPNDHRRWTEAVTRLLLNPDERARIHAKAAALCRSSRAGLPVTPEWPQRTSRVK